MIRSVADQTRVVQIGELVLGCADETDFDPDAVTSRLGITPSRCWKRGQTRPAGHLARTTKWIWQTPEQTQVDREPVIQQVLDTFEPVAITLATLVQELDLWVCIGLVVKMHGNIELEPDGTQAVYVTTPGLSLSAATLARIAGLGAELDVDQYVYAP